MFDKSCLHDPDESARLSALVKQILLDGSGQLGLRTEPKEGVSPLGNYPHIMPLVDEREVRRAMETVLGDHPGRAWWFLVNEAFTEYEWNAVVMVTHESGMTRGLRLIGEVNDQDNLPLREAMDLSANLTTLESWKHSDKEWLRSVITMGGLLNEWLEVSSVYARGHGRKVFWGMR